MNYNVESHFSELPRVDIERSILDLSHGNKTSGNFSDLVPFDLIEVLPGDTLKVITSKVIRLQTLATPVMDNCFADVFWFYVPNRLVWTHWKEFCGENTQSAWIPSTQYTIPTISSPASTGFATNGIADYLGLPVGVVWNATDVNAPSALPFRGYALIANEFFRDQNVTDPLNIPLGDSNQTGTNGTSYINDVANGGACFKVAKTHDYFTSCLPSPQKGISPQFNLINGSLAPVISSGDSSIYLTGASAAMMLHTTDGNAISGNHQLGVLNDRAEVFTSTVSTAGSGVYPINLFADLSNSVGAVTVNELRLAFQLQKFYEKQARAGSRYTELVREMFGTISPDGRIQRPEFLGGSRIPINITQIANTAQTNSDFLGDVGALSVTGDVSEDFEKSFTEHGYVFGLMCLRYTHSYSQGMHKHWLRKKFTDFYLPVFANIGEQPVHDCEIYADATTLGTDSVFGYQEAWAEYRYLPDRTTGEMRPGIANTLSSWHFGDYYTQKPTLSDGWIREDKSNVDRTLVVTSANANQWFADIEVKCIATRPMPVYSIPGLIDHH